LNIKPIFNSAIIRDEDLSTTISALTTKSYTTMYIDINNNPVFKTDYQFIFTVSLACGAVVPMPTLPFPETTNLVPPTNV